MKQFSLLALGAAALVSAPALAQVSTYDDLAEGFLGSAFSYNGVNYSEVNDVGGSFPGGDTFVPADIGNNFIIENATLLYNDFPAWGSSPNALTFGTAFIPGDNLSLGAFARATMSFDQVVDSVRMDMVFYENGPWGGIVFHLDGLRNGSVVASDSFTISDLGGRDSIAFSSLSISGQEFDGARIYATNGADYSAPRLMIDNLTLTPVPAPASAGVLLALAGAARRRRR